MRKLLLAGLLATLPAAPLQAASFDCNKASTAVERAICNNLQLNQLDTQLGELYSQLLKNLPRTGAGDLKQEQLGWLKQRDQACQATQTQCLLEFYQARITVLRERLRQQVNRIKPEQPGDVKIGVKTPAKPETGDQAAEEERFVLENALARLRALESTVYGMRDSLEKSDKKLNSEEWELHYLGVPNWIGSVEGTLYRQNYLLKKSHYELMEARRRNGEATPSEVEQAYQAYQKAREDFIKFWNNFKVVD